jgi:oligoendopeptidase F
LAEARVPLIFRNAVGLQGDVEAMPHEAGHAFSAPAARVRCPSFSPRRVAALNSAAPRGRS